MSTKLADLQHPSAAADDDEENSLSRSVERSSEPDRVRGDFIERAIDSGDTATMLIALGAAGAVLIVFLAWGWTTDLWRLARWTVPIPWVLAAVGAWFGFKELRAGWRNARAKMRATLAAGLEWRSPQEELDRAVSIKDAALVRRVLSTPMADVNRFRGSYEPTLLHGAVRWFLYNDTLKAEHRKDALNTVRALLESGALCSAHDRHKGTPLDRIRDACKDSDGIPAELILLLQNAIDKEKRDKAIKADEDEIRLNTIHHRRNRKQRTELFTLAAATHTDDWWPILDEHNNHDDDSMKSLLNSFDSTGRTVLHWAAFAENLDLVRWLARHGAGTHERWNGECHSYNDDGNPLDADGYSIDFHTPFDGIEDDEVLHDLTDAFAAGLREREADALRVAIDEMNLALPTHARKRL